jgi:hypothetical protein
MLALAASSRAQSDKKGLTHDHHLQVQRERAGRTRLEGIGIKTAVNRRAAGHQGERRVADKVGAM